MDDELRKVAVDKYLAEAIRAGKMNCDRLILTSLDGYTTEKIESATASLKASLDRIGKLMAAF